MNKNYFIFLLQNVRAVIFLLCLSVTGYTQCDDHTLLINKGGEYPVHKYLFYNVITDIQNPSEVTDTVHKKEFKSLYPKHSFSAGVDHKYVWLMVTVKNNLSKDVTLFFEVNNPGLNIVKAYKKTSNAITSAGQAGEHLQVDTRPVKYYDLVFPFQVSKGETATLLVYIDNGGENVDCLPQLFDENFFNAKQQRYYVVNGIITGIMLTACLLNLFLAVSLRDKLHLLYAFYVAAILFEMYVVQGIDVQYIYPLHPQLSDVFKYISPVISLTLMAYVMQVFLQQTKANSRVKILVDVTKWFIVALVPLFFILYVWFPGSNHIMGMYEQVFALSLTFQLLLFFLAALEKVIQRFKPAYFYLAAIVYLWYGAIQYVVTILGGDTKEMIEQQPNALQIGIVVETMIVFLGIIYRYHLFKKENQQLSITLKNEKLQSMEQILITQQSEQKRIAEDLHDQLGSNLAAIKMSLHAHNINGIMPAEAYGQLTHMISQATEDLRRIAHNLMPPEFSHTSLPEIISAHISRLNTAHDIFRFTVSGYRDCLTKQQELLVYRIVLELTNNIVRHAAATEASLQLNYHSHHLDVVAEDNGTGFSDKEEKGIGLANIKSRVSYFTGHIHIDTGKQGTTILIKLPYKQPAND